MSIDVSTTDETAKLDPPNESTKGEEPAPTKKRLERPSQVTANSRIIWEYVIPVLVFHLTIPLAFIPYVFSWWGVAWLFVGNFLFCSIGIGAGYHRLLTHRGFKSPLWFERFLTFLGVCCFQDSPARWVLVHRIHHQHSDHQEDPHSPLVSTWWGHVGWLFVDNKNVSSFASYDKYVRDILRDPFYQWMERGLNWVWVYVAHGVAITLLGAAIGFAVTGTLAGMLQWGVQWLLWGVIFRTIYTWHVTWGINSFSHLWGYRNYETRENSRNNWLFAILTNGEGWHNNHHADPRSSAHGHKWWEIDITYICIRMFGMVGLATDIVGPSAFNLERKKNTADEEPKKPKPK